MPFEESLKNPLENGQKPSIESLKDPINIPRNCLNNPVTLAWNPPQKSSKIPQKLPENPSKTLKNSHNKKNPPPKRQKLAQIHPGKIRTESLKILGEFRRNWLKISNQKGIEKNGQNQLEAAWKNPVRILKNPWKNSSRIARKFHEKWIKFVYKKDPEKLLQKIPKTILKNCTKKFLK